MIGRFISSWLLARVNPGTILAAATGGLVVLSMAASGGVAGRSLIAVGLFNSIMFRTILSLALEGQGARTPQASGFCAWRSAAARSFRCSPGASRGSPARRRHRDAPACVRRVCTTQAVAGFASWSHMPSGQIVLAAEPPRHCVPLSQAWQTGAVVAQPGVSSNVPASQAVPARQDSWFGVEVWVPERQTSHTRSTSAEGATLTWLPTSQVDHAEQVDAFSTVLKVPLAQGEHTRSAAAVAAPET